MVLTIVTTVTPATFNGNYDGAIVVNSVSGTGPFVYSWSDGSGSANRSNLRAGTYVLTVTNGTDSGTSTNVITQPAPALLLVTTPLTISATWPRLPGEITYRVVYRKTGDLVDATPYRNTRDTHVILKGLASASTYTVTVYSSANGMNPQTLKYTGVCSTPVNSIGNFNKAGLKQNTAIFDVETLLRPPSTESVSAAKVINSSFQTGDRVKTTAVVNGGVNYIDPMIVKVGESVKINPRDSVLLPFDEAGVDGQTVTLTLRDNSVAVVSYDKIKNTVTIGGNTYSTGDTFILDRQRVTVSAR